MCPPQPGQSCRAGTRIRSRSGRRRADTLAISRLQEPPMTAPSTLHARQLCRPRKKGADGEERDRREALGRPRGGYGTKACVIADGRGRAIAFALAPGQAHELPLAPGLLNCLPDVPGWIIGDRALLPMPSASASGTWARVPP